ncbi:ABC transporter permease [Gemmiger gallinarum]|uniref:ABC transporter permease n=1 Tax=Gemmiger gallinarum TaxID=2779354 RepID=UPI0038B416C9
MALFGYALGAVVGVPLGIAMAWNKWVDRFVRPLFDLIRPIPGLAWIPMFILLFGIGITSKALVIFLGALIACVVNSYTGIQQTQELHLWVGDVFGASNAQKLFKIAIPTALPMIFTGLRVALGTSWTALVAAELLASTQGLGYMIQQARAISRSDIIIVGMLAIGAVGAVFDALLHLVEIKVAKGMNAE